MNKRTISLNVRKAGSLLLAIAMLLMMTAVPAEYSSAAENTHHLVFASDYRMAEGSIEKAMKDMPSDTEYVSLIGDMAGETAGDHPAYKSSDILSLVNKTFPDLKKDNVSMVWADHDYSVNDDAGIVKCGGGRNSGLLYTGKNSDGSVAYYIYGIGFYDMTDGGETSKTAAKAFKNWSVSNGVDQTVPVIVLCHVPILAARGDNNGATYWNEALNYVATGTEGITTAEKTGNLRRNVIFLSGHNYTCDPAEYYYPAGGKMTVQIDGSGSAQSGGEAALQEDTVPDDAALQEEGSSPEGPSQEEAVLQEEAAAAGDAALQEETTNQTTISKYDTELGTNTKAVGQPSNIYYTSLTAGYLKTTGNATLITIDNDAITLNKYNDGTQVDLGTNGETDQDTGKTVVIKKITTKTAVEHSSVTVTKTDASGNTLNGAEFTLTDADNKQIATYTGGVFSISSNDSIFTDRLPAVGSTVTFTLKETKAPTGFSLSATARKIEIKAAGEEKTVDSVLTRTTRYTITIDGKGSEKIVNTKPGAAGTSGSNSSSSKVGNVPKTGDNSYIEAYIAAAVLAGILLAALAVRRRRRSS